jgi:hypothetical protein
MGPTRRAVLAVQRVFSRVWCSEKVVVFHLLFPYREGDVLGKPLQVFGPWVGRSVWAFAVSSRACVEDLLPQQVFQGGLVGEKSVTHSCGGELTVS